MNTSEQPEGPYNVEMKADKMATLWQIVGPTDVDQWYPNGAEAVHECNRLNAAWNAALSTVRVGEPAQGAEEAANELCPKPSPLPNDESRGELIDYWHQAGKHEGFIAGANWQASRSGGSASQEEYEAQVAAIVKACCAKGNFMDGMSHLLAWMKTIETARLSPSAPVEELVKAGEAMRERLISLGAGLPETAQWRAVVSAITSGRNEQDEQAPNSTNPNPNLEP